jgi:hypothetical protein
LRREGRVSRRTCGFYPCAFLLHRGPRVRQAPGFPCALCYRGPEFSHASGASRREKAESYLVVIACDKREAFAQGSEATKQSILSFARRNGLLRGACHRARIRATRWLAMTSPSRFDRCRLWITGSPGQAGSAARNAGPAGPSWPVCSCPCEKRAFSRPRAACTVKARLWLSGIFIA